MDHRSRDTAYRYHCGAETKAAVAPFDQDVLALKDELRAGAERKPCRD
ncbi:MAG: hypothetical protein ACJ8H8_19925 [Geminicoccaceae bacterium]